MKDSLMIKFLYKTIPGRIFLKLLVNPGISKAFAKYLSSPASRFWIPVFIKKNNINMSSYKIPEGGYKSFNDFFTREMEQRIPDEQGELVSPCDGLLTVADINEKSEFNIKHTNYSLSVLLESDELAREYQNGTAFIFRLTPAHYHRYIWSSSGYFCEKKHIDGVLHSVRPVCHEKSKVFVKNTREYALINTPSIGKLIQMEIGALLVGKISNYDWKLSNMVRAGQEKGYFEYGGSSIVVLTKKRVDLAKQLQNRPRIGTEIPVSIGETLVF